MSTKYILHGGNAQDVNDENILFFQEILSSYINHANVLLVQFAAVSEKQEVYKQRHIAQFERAKGQRTLSYEVSDVGKFDEQLKWADVVYLCGSAGGTVRLLDVLSRVQRLKQKFDEKTVAGESAGANILSVNCFSRSNGIMHCLGIVPVNLIAHYQSGDELEMNNIDNDLEVLMLKNYEFRVYDI
jgi:peptidase E